MNSQSNKNFLSSREISEYRQSPKCREDYIYFAKLSTFLFGLSKEEKGSEKYKNQLRVLIIFLEENEEVLLNLSPYVTTGIKWKAMMRIIDLFVSKNPNTRYLLDDIIPALHWKSEIMQIHEMVSKTVYNTCVANGKREYSFVFWDDWDMRMYEDYKKSSKSLEDSIDLKYLLMILRDFKGTLHITEKRLEAYLEMPVYASDDVLLWRQLYDTLEITKKNFQLDSEDLKIIDSLMKVFHKNMVFENSRLYKIWEE